MKTDYSKFENGLPPSIMAGIIFKGGSEKDVGKGLTYKILFRSSKDNIKVEIQETKTTTDFDMWSLNSMLYSEKYPDWFIIYFPHQCEFCS